MRRTVTARHRFKGRAASRARPHTPPPHTAGCRRPPGPPNRSATGSAPWTGRRQRGRRCPLEAPSVPAPWPPPSWDAADAVDPAARPVGPVEGGARALAPLSSPRQREEVTPLQMSMLEGGSGFRWRGSWCREQLP